MARVGLKELLCLLMMVLNMLQTCSADTNSICPKPCICSKTNGKWQASCENGSFKTIPSLKEDTQRLLLDNNNISVLHEKIFESLNLNDLQKLSLKNNGLKVIEKNAFSKCGILIEIDLSFNQITELYPHTFSSTEKLTSLNLNDNSIEKIEDGLFSSLAHLQVVDLNNNKISDIGMKAFTNLPALSTLKLSGNRLKHTELSIFYNINKLGSLDLTNNPWECDCHLRKLVEWCKDRKLCINRELIRCQEPETLRGADWHNIAVDKFACRPEILMAEYKMENGGDTSLLSCLVNGDPSPTTQWTFNSRPLNSNIPLGMSKLKYLISEGNASNGYWYNATVQKMGRLDYGVYICAAQNPAGLVERNVTISDDQSFFPFPHPDGGNLWLMLTCILIAIILSLLFIFAVCFFCCRRRENIKAKKSSNLAVTSNGDIAHHIMMESAEQQKTLLTAINPVQKPPRKYDSSPRSEHNGTELTELSRHLLDDTSILGVSVAGDSMDDRRSSTSLEQLSCHSQDNLLFPDRVRPIPIRAHCPPDLLAFPNNRRLRAASPASSCVSTDLDGAGSVSSYRFRTLNSPVWRPIYQVHPYNPTYETLPYPRTQSPFGPVGGGMTPPVQMQRQGYVTIPRRPRIPSWASAPTPTIERALLQDEPEPVYDNMGPRTTADGSSVLSLPRKVSLEAPAGRLTPRSLAPSPLYTSHTLPHKSKFNHGYLPIRENEEPHFHPMKQSNGVVIRPMPLQFQAPGDELPSPTVADVRRASWAMRQTQMPETGTLRKTPSELPSNETETRSPLPTPIKSKVPPEPPPKPKKNGVLFEDESEDGTEV